MKRKLSVIAALLAGIVMTGCTAAPSVELHTRSGNSELSELWVDYPDNLDKIKSEWAGDTLHVSTIKNGFSGWDVEEKRTSVSIQGDRMRLCYTYVIDEEEKKLPAVTASLFPIAFDFYVHGASKRDYQIEIIKNCSS